MQSLQDPWTPLNYPLGKFFIDLAATNAHVDMHILPETGHCPMDDRPEAVAEKLMPWLDKVQRVH